MIDDARARNAEATRTRLAERLDPVIAAHQDLWLARNRPGGLSDSTAWLERLRDSYRTGEVDADWLPPGLRPV